MDRNCSSSSETGRESGRSRERGRVSSRSREQGGHSLERDRSRKRGRESSPSREQGRESGYSSQQGCELERDRGRETGKRRRDASRDRGRRRSPVRGRDLCNGEHGQERSCERSSELDSGAHQGPQCADDEAQSEVSNRKVYVQDQCRRINGEGGCNIKAIRRHSGCQINMSTRPDSGDAKQERTATFSGTRVQVDRAMSMVEDLLASSVDQVFTEAFFERWRLGGKTTAATIEQHCEAEAREQSIGSAAAAQVVTRSYEQSSELDSGAHHQGPQCAGDEAQSEVSNSKVYAQDQCSRIIGRGGSNINAIRKHSGCHVVMPTRPASGDAKQERTATFSGTQVQVDRAMSMVEKLLASSVGQNFTEAFNESLQLGGKTTATTVEQHCEAEMREQSIGSAAAAQVVTRSCEQSNELDSGAHQGSQCAGDEAQSEVSNSKVYAQEQCSRIIGRGGSNIRAIRRYSGCRVDVSTRPAWGDAKQEQTAMFSGTRVQVNLAMAMVEGLLASSVVQNFTEAFYNERWRLGGKTTAATACAIGSRATRPEVISKGYPAPSVNHGVGGAGHGSASFAPVMEAAPCVAFHCDGYGPTPFDTTTIPVLCAAQTCFSMECSPFLICRIIGRKGVAFDARAINAAIITLKQTACRCPTVGAAAPTAIGGRRAGA